MPNFSLGSPKLEISLYDDFEPFYLARSNLNDDMPLPSLEQDSSLPTSLSPDIASHTSLPKDVTEDVLVYTNSPAPFNHSCEFEVGEDFENPNELDMSITNTVKHHDELEAIVHESCEKEDEPTNLKFEDDVLPMKYESFFIWV